MLITKEHLVQEIEVAGTLQENNCWTLIKFGQTFSWTLKSGS